MNLSPEEQVQLESLLRGGGIRPVRTVQRAWVLLQLGKGQSCIQVAANVGVVVNTVCEIRKRYEQGGLARALYDKARPGAEPLLKARERQQIIAMVCGPAPAGRARWSVRLIAVEAVKRGLVPRVGRETIRVLLQTHELKPWREKNVVCAGVGSGVCAADGGCAGSL
jgi:putative transposase